MIGMKKSGLIFHKVKESVILIIDSFILFKISKKGKGEYFLNEDYCGVIYINM